MADDGRTLVVRLSAGLGNQLFQFAAGCGLARGLGRDLYVYEKVEVGFSEFVQIDFQTATNRMVERLVLADSARSTFLGRGLWEVNAQLQRIDPRSFTFRQRDPFDGAENSRLSRHKGLLGLAGYFQHPRWFEAVLPEILDSLRRSIARRVRPAERSFSQELGDFTVVSLRRGDYVRHDWALPLDYYESALNALPRADGPLIVLSDDEVVSAFAAPWFKGKGFDVIPDSVLGERSRHRDFALLSDASQVVMSNSSFCWWGTVLGDESPEVVERERFVVAPRNWIPEYASSSALLRSGWVAL